MQSKKQSMMEALAGTAIGMVISVLLGLAVYPVFGHAFTLQQNLGITMIFTVVSVVRGYLVRRAFNALHGRQADKWSPSLSVRAQIDSMVADNEHVTMLYGFDAALLGVSVSSSGCMRVVYDEDAILQIMVQRDGMSEEYAAEFLEYHIRPLTMVKPNPLLLVSVLAADAALRI